MSSTPAIVMASPDELYVGTPGSLGSETLVVRTPAAVDPFGDPVPGTQQTVTVTGCVVYPRTTTEDEFRAATVVTGLIALLPILAVYLDPTYQIQYRGVWYDIDGAIGQWTYLDGRDAGTQVQLKGATG